MAVHHPPTDTMAARPNGHHNGINHRENEFGVITTLSHSLVKGNFPTFDGDNTRLWISRVESYFEMYDVEPIAWVKVSSMYFTDAGAQNGFSPSSPNFRTLCGQSFAKCFMSGWAMINKITSEPCMARSSIFSTSVKNL